MTLLDALQQSFEFAQVGSRVEYALCQEFNRQIELRQSLKRLGFMKEVPGTLEFHLQMACRSYSRKQLPGLRS